MRVRRDCFSDDWEESILELLFFISPGRVSWSGGQTPDWAAKEAGGHRLAGELPPYVAQVCRFEDRSSPTGSWYSYIHMLLTIKLAGGMTATSLQPPKLEGWVHFRNARLRTPQFE